MWPFRTAPEETTQTDAVLRALVPDVRRWIARYAGPRSDLDDLVQETMIELVVALERFRGDSSVRTYAHRIAIRTTQRELAKRRQVQRHLELVGEVEASSIGDPERSLASRRALMALYQALSQLSEKRRSAFVLCAIERLPHDEAAAIEAVSVETLRARLKHARADLAVLFAHDAELSSLTGDGS
jgi:RNA polymerase sigma-70 factor (ECF subfamily)